VDSFGGRSFAQREGSSNSTHFTESLKKFPLTSDDVVRLYGLVFHHSPCVRMFADSIGE